MRGASGGHCDGGGSQHDHCGRAAAAKPHPDRREARYHSPHAGESIDVLVTDHGIAINPARPEIRERLMEAGMKVVDINALYERAISLTGVPKPIEFTDKIVGVIRYRDGSVIDTVRQVKEEV